jgi:hypothetical protein
MGIVVEYANSSGEAQWQPVQKTAMPMWNYLAFGGKAPAADPDRRFELVSLQQRQARLALPQYQMLFWSVRKIGPVIYSIEYR